MSQLENMKHEIFLIFCVSDFVINFLSDYAITPGLYIHPTRCPILT